MLTAVGWDLPRWEGIVPISASTGALLIIAGLTMPAWGPSLDTAAATVRSVRLLRQLRPLWTALCTAVPGVRLSHDLRWWRPADRLHRRVIEIYDARLVLRPYLSEAVGDHARRRAAADGLHGEDLAARVEAAKLRAALAAMRADVRSTRPEQPGPPDPGLDEVREVEQLARVARAFAAYPPLDVDRSLPGPYRRNRAADRPGGRSGRRSGDGREGAGLRGGLSDASRSID